MTEDDGRLVEVLFDGSLDIGNAVENGDRVGARVVGVNVGKFVVEEVGVAV